MRFPDDSGATHSGINLLDRHLPKTDHQTPELANGMKSEPLESLREILLRRDHVRVPAT